MPYELVWEDHGVVTRYWGEITREEYIDSIRSMSPDSRYKSLSYELETFSESGVAKISVEAVRRVARMDADASKKFPVRAVAIVGSQELIRGLNNLYRLQHEATGGHWTTKYFDTEEEARQWLAEMLDE